MTFTQASYGVGFDGNVLLVLLTLCGGLSILVVLSLLALPFALKKKPIPAIAAGVVGLFTAALSAYCWQAAFPIMLCLAVIIFMLSASAIAIAIRTIKLQNQALCPRCKTRIASANETCPNCDLILNHTSKT